MNLLLPGAAWLLRFSEETDEEEISEQFDEEGRQGRDVRPGEQSEAPGGGELGQRRARVEDSDVNETVMPRACGNAVPKERDRLT